MKSSELNRVVAEYYKLHKKFKLLAKELDKRRGLILESVPEGTSKTKNGKYQISKLKVPEAYVEALEKSSYFKLEISKL